MSSPCCDGCFRVDKSTNAVRFCMDCEESLCHECVAAHKTIKILTTHQLVDLKDSSAGKRKDLAAKRYCKTHKDYTLEYFCTYHDTLCCHACIPVDHRACDKILPLNEASKDVKSSALFSDISDGLKLVSTTASETMQNREENIQRVNEQATLITGSISASKETIINKLDEMEKCAMKGLSDLKIETISTLSNEKDSAKDIKSTVEEYSEQLQFMIENGSENQTFVFLQELRVLLLNQDQTLKDDISKLGELDLKFTERNVIGEKELGSIKVSSEPCDVQHKHTKQFGAQIMMPIRKTPKKITYNSKLKIEPEMDYAEISGIAFDDRELHVCLGNTLCTYSADKKCTSKVVLKKKPWDIAVHSKSGKIVATLRNGSLQIIENRKSKTKFDTQFNESYGVAWNNNDLVVGGASKIYFLNSNMDHIKTLKIGDGLIYYIHSRDDHIYLSDYTFDKVYCIDKEGNIIFTFSSPTLKSPDGITTDGNGNVYVVGRKSNNVHRLTPNGTESEVILTAEDGIKDPIAICFSHDYKSLYLSNESGKSVWIFDCD
ncbi:transcription intermediary factor 1-alpha-like [Mytilus trossulus]|uniref:transcription intermediary factor 1-alpha-like n=1 Tax=Mytilus trossulus TaxID=6551 RepID=UPI003003FAD6